MENTTHQLNKNELRNLKCSKEDFKNIKRNNLYIVLDSLKVHHNIGTIFRLCDALLIKKIYLCGQTKTPPNYKIKKSSKGAEKWVNWEYIENAEDIIKKLKQENVEIVSLEITNDSISYLDYTPSKEKVCLILGREFDGISQNLLELSDVKIHLPIMGMCNSINVSNAAAVSMYDIINKL